MAASAVYESLTCSSANMSAMPDLSSNSSSSTQKQPFVYSQDRWAVRLNEPTIASIRRKAALSKYAVNEEHRKDKPIMPTSNGPQTFLSSLPTFMSVFGQPSSTSGNAPENQPPLISNLPLRTTNTNKVRPIASRGSSQTNSLSSIVLRRDSGTTLKTESTESSPTTTISTLDSSLTEPSPSSSPESPSGASPLSSMQSTKLSVLSPNSGLAFRSHGIGDTSPNRSGYNRAASPNKRLRNSKNLFVNTNSSNRLSTSTSLPRLAGLEGSSTVDNSATGISKINVHALSAPASPSFIVPVIPPRRKPSKLGLSITTPDTSGSGPKNQVPPTPAFGFNTQTSRKASTDGPPSDSIMSPIEATEGGNNFLFSPTGAPPGGMQLPPLGGGSSESSPFSKNRPALSLSQTSMDSSRDSPVVRQTIEHNLVQPDHDLPQSQEAKSPTYPDGPVCIYPSVYLYLEPKDFEASQFDVVINVAREVVNPFVAAEEARRKAEEPKYKDVGVQVSIMPGNSIMDMINMEREAARAKEESLAVTSSQQIPREEAEAPDTPKAEQRRPEYVHMPWDHNTSVHEEMISLCQLIENRVKQGKRVLIHCQCGVSRSACLMIAYGLWSNPDWKVPESYDHVKGQSRWINPNMFFMFELNDFKRLLEDRERERERKGVPQSLASFGLKGSNSRALLTRTKTDSFLPSISTFSPMSPIEDEPASAPLRQDSITSPDDSLSTKTPGSAFFTDTSNIGDVSPGPSSAPADMAWSPTSAVDDEPHREEAQLVEGSTLPLQPPPSRRPPPPPPSLSQALVHDTVMQDADTAQSENSTPQAGILPESLTQMTIAPVAPLAHAENLARNTETLPPPNLSIPSKRSEQPQPPQQVPHRTIRPMASLPGGFSSIMSRRGIAGTNNVPQTPLLTAFNTTKLSLPKLSTGNHLDHGQGQGQRNTPALPSMAATTSTTPYVSIHRPTDSTLDRAIAGGNSAAGSSLLNDGETSLMSPRAAEFTASPFHRSAAGDLAGTGFGDMMSPTTAAAPNSLLGMGMGVTARDPRSPATRGEAPIVRSIDDVL